MVGDDVLRLRHDDDVRGVFTKRPPSTKGGTYLTDCGIQYCSESSTHELYVLYLILILCITCLISVPPVFRFSAVSA